MHTRLALITIITILVATTTACAKATTSCADPEVLVDEAAATCRVEFRECDDGKEYELQCDGAACTCLTQEDAEVLVTGEFGRDVSAEDPCGADNDPTLIAANKCGYVLDQ